MRTYLFGALVLQKRSVAFKADEAFVAAALHDVGLLTHYASESGSFETDGANAAESFARDNGLDAAEAATVWHSVAFHDTRFAGHAEPEARLVAIGAGSDVDGPPALVTPDEISAVVAAFPRLQFKQRFTALLIDHCRRKPLSQRGTWLEGLCREQAPQAWTDTVEQEIAQSPFAE